MKNENTTLTLKCDGSGDTETMSFVETPTRTERGTVRTIKRPGTFQTCENHGRRVIRNVESYYDSFGHRMVYLGWAVVNGETVEVSADDLSNWLTNPNSDYYRRCFERRG